MMIMCSARHIAYDRTLDNGTYIFVIFTDFALITLYHRFA